ncbi:MAG TPA: hypothetical protein VJ991_02725 [Balneolales bacterium]|nr:hypothetical protein [Balneolales bacterium]
MFKNRKNAGHELGKSLEQYKTLNPLVLALPPGGVIVGYHTAKYLDADFDILLSNKLVYPNNPEAAFGAVTEDGSIYLAEFAKKDLVQETIDKIVANSMKEIDRLKAYLRDNKPLPDLTNRIVILVNDGIVTASVLQASIIACQKHEAQKVIVAAPVADKDIINQLRSMVDDITVLETYKRCRSIAQGYDDYPNLTDQDLKRIIDLWNDEHING